MLMYNFIEIILRHGCSPTNSLHIFSSPFSKNTIGKLLMLVFIVKPFYKFFRPMEELRSVLVHTFSKICDLQKADEL